MLAAKLRAICSRQALRDPRGCARSAHVRVLPKECEVLQELDAMTQCELLAEHDPHFALSPP